MPARGTVVDKERPFARVECALHVGERRSIEGAHRVAPGRDGGRGREDARAGLPSQLAAELARIHSITPATHPDLFGTRKELAGLDPVGSTLALLRLMIDDLGEPRPALELAMRWLDENRPARSEVTLV